MLGRVELETDLEFIEKDGDVYVGVKSIFDG